MIDMLSILSTLMLGLFAGSLLTEGSILVPYWQRMPPEEFFRLHGTLGPKLFRYFAPLTIITIVAAVIVAAINGAANMPWNVSAVLCLVTFAIFFIYFRTANNRFATHDISDEALESELVRWSNWHWLRTVLIIAAFGASIYGHTQ